MDDFTKVIAEARKQVSSTVEKVKPMLPTLQTVQPPKPLDIPTQIRQYKRLTPEGHRALREKYGLDDYNRYIVRMGRLAKEGGDY